MSSGGELRLLFVADVVGRPGREAVQRLVPQLRDELHADLVVVNGENAAAGFGVTAKLCGEIFDAGADVITLGNHVFDQREFVNELPQLQRVVRPANLPPGAPGVGSWRLDVKGVPVLVMCVMGRLFMNDIDDPFRAADAVLAENEDVRVVFVDMHAEATSEKQALGWYLDGRVSAVVGTHTHVATADPRLLTQGTAYCTDAGMVGPRDGVIGMDKENILKRFLTSVPHRFEVAEGAVTFNSVLITIDSLTGHATAIQRVDRELT